MYNKLDTSAPASKLLERLSSTSSGNSNFEDFRDKCGQVHAAWEGWLGKFVGKTAYDMRRLDENTATAVVALAGAALVVIANPVGGAAVCLAPVPFAAAMIARSTAGFLEPRTAEQEAAHENVLSKPGAWGDGKTVVSPSLRTPKML